MSDIQAIEFYSTLRKDAEALGRLATASNEAQLIELILDEAGARNIMLDASQVKAGLADLGSLIGKAAGGEELQDFELELVSGGIESAWEQWERAKKENAPCK
ncbi:hypothetical protein [Ensifer adhaerens]|uniref:hypothetical protein n=1 Tax=Ensifer adhaerens TaxID=106592 RepID=UPI000CF1037B|nr:hypothetical protein [Ensifer adhaerens]